MKLKTNNTTQKDFIKNVLPKGEVIFAHSPFNKYHAHPNNPMPWHVSSLTLSKNIVTYWTL